MTNFVELASQKKAAAFQTQLESTLGEKIASALETKKVEVAGKMFGEETINEVHVSTDGYQASHGRGPRGHGSFFFSAHRGGVDFDKHKEGQDYIQTPHGSYTEAKQKAVEWAKSKGHHTIHVAS